MDYLDNFVHGASTARSLRQRAEIACYVRYQTYAERRCCQDPAADCRAIELILTFDETIVRHLPASFYVTLGCWMGCVQLVCPTRLASSTCRHCPKIAKNGYRLILRVRVSGPQGEMLSGLL